MQRHKLNWPILVGFILSIFAMLSYPLIFAAWPETRDFPWMNLLLFGVAALLLFIGIRRAFGPGRGWFSKIGASLLAGIAAFAAAMFVLTFVSGTWLPESAGAPKTGDQAPQFTLTDTGGKKVSLSQLLTEPISTSSPAPRAVVLIFYRGYW